MHKKQAKINFAILILLVALLAATPVSIYFIHISYETGYQAGKAEACKDVNDISYTIRTATCEVFRDE